jgi:hypothetical protein
MFALKDGLQFEDSFAILPWGCNRKEAWRAGKPYRCFPDDDTRIKWDETILNGLRCTILTYLPETTALKEISISLRLDDTTFKGDEPLTQYSTIFDHLVREIGQPIITPRPLGFYAPILRWYHEDCVLQLVTGERHGDSTMLEITRGKLPRYPLVDPSELR